ncbi:MAG: CRTAC1 family protein, partial [Anaerolineae bacterium]
YFVGKADLFRKVEAQMFPAFGVAVVDANGDGHDDVVLVGNFSAAEAVHTGPMDGGVGALLAGDGSGRFMAVPPGESGLWVPYDARGLAVGDYDGDGWSDLAVGINDGPAMLFHNTGVDGRSGLLVALRGPESNPTGVGARVEVTRSDGLVMVREVRAGGSYLSQHGAALTFGLGHDRGPARVRVTWPDATAQTAEALPGEPVVISWEEGTR